MKYDFLKSLNPLPKILAMALQYLGVKEIPGSKSNPVILNMADQLGLGNIYKNDDTSWCALFMSFICTVCGKPLPSVEGDLYNMLRAKWFLNYGEAVEKGQEMLGDILIFQRPGGGHVGIYVGESDTTFHVLGGNQSNAVTIAEIKKDRCIGARRLYRTGVPQTVKKYRLDSSGNVSTNEA